MTRGVVLANGCFDLFHYGHLLHLRAAADMGDLLVVSITRDRSVGKGAGRPVIPEAERAAIVGDLQYVEEVILVDSAIEALERVMPETFVKGKDYRRSITPDVRDWCRAHEVRIRFTDTKKMSTTEIHERIRACS